MARIEHAISAFKGNLFMMRVSKPTLYYTTLIVGAFLFLFAVSAFAQGAADDPSQSIENKEAEIEGVQRKYKSMKKIGQFESQEHSLSNEIAILENRAKRTELNIQEMSLPSRSQS